MTATATAATTAAAAALLCCTTHNLLSYIRRHTEKKLASHPCSRLPATVPSQGKKTHSTRSREISRACLNEEAGGEIVLCV